MRSIFYVERPAEKLCPTFLLSGVLIDETLLVEMFIKISG